jgi:hypothetical protein
MRSARHGIERDLGFEQFASQEVSIGHAAARAANALPLDDRLPSATAND